MLSRDIHSEVSDLYNWQPVAHGIWVFHLRRDYKLALVLYSTQKTGRQQNRYGELWAFRSRKERSRAYMDRVPIVKGLPEGELIRHASAVVEEYVKGGTKVLDEELDGMIKPKNSWL